MTDPIPDEQATVKQVLELNERLMMSITEGDWETYSELCDPTLTAFEPEARGQLVEGMEFHGFYFDRGGISGPHNTTICAPHVRLLDNVAVVCYVRLLQRLDDAYGRVPVPGVVGSGKTRRPRAEDGHIDGTAVSHL